VRSQEEFERARGFLTLLLTLGFLAFFLAGALHSHALPKLAAGGPSLHAQHERSDGAGDCLACRSSSERAPLPVLSGATHGLAEVRSVRQPTLLPAVEHRVPTPSAPRAPPTLPPA